MEVNDGDNSADIATCPHYESAMWSQLHTTRQYIFYLTHNHISIANTQLRLIRDNKLSLNKSMI